MKRARDEASFADSTPKSCANCSTYIQILGTVTGDSCPAILIVTEAARYLFNAGEGLQVEFLFAMLHIAANFCRKILSACAFSLLIKFGHQLVQRFCNQHQVRLTRLSNLFLTKLHADTIGGLLGNETPHLYHFI